jgi:hypothetical protein
MVFLIVSVRQNTPRSCIIFPKSFHEKAGTCQDGFFFFFSGGFFRLSRAASVAILPSALFVSEFSLGASWASFVQ